MSDHVFVVSEWLPKQGCEEELLRVMKGIMENTRRESGCVRAHATKQISHPGSPGTSKYTIILLQEYRSVEAFDLHCQSDYVAEGFKTHVDNEMTGLVEDWTCRLFTEA